MAHPEARPETTEGAAPARSRRAGVLRWIARGLAALLALVVLALGALWAWAAGEGSLATALRWAGAHAALQADGVHGRVLGGGTVAQLSWDDGAGLRVQARDVALRWTPRALLAGTLRIEQLSAERIVVDDRRAPQESTGGPPQTLALPLTLRVDALRVGELQWAGPPPHALHDIAARYAYDGHVHRLALEHARFERGDVRARASVTARQPLRLELVLAAALSAEVPAGEQPLALVLQASVQGPLDELQARADLRGAPQPPGAQSPALPALPALPTLAPGAGAAADDTSEGPAVHARARITPWAAQPLPEARLALRALDLGAIWAAAPRTRLGGTLELAPLASPTTPDAGWTLRADLDNQTPGPWDQRALPLEHLEADVDWHDRTALVRTLEARVAGGALAASGRWVAPPAATPPDGRGDAAQEWQVEARFDGVDPARLDTRLAALPVDGTARATGAGAALDFAFELQARARPGAAPGVQAAAAAPGLPRDLQALRLRDASARGRWDAGRLDLRQLRVRSDDAELAGTADLQLDGAGGPGGEANLRLSAPGAALELRGAAWPERGDGTLRATVADAARALAWARRLPGLATALADAQADGRATLDASWRGGWRNPALQARIAAPALRLRAPGSGAQAAPLRVRDLDLGLQGRLDAAQLTVSGEFAQGERKLALQLGADGGRASPASTPLAATGWKARITRLQADLQAPELGSGRWHLATEGPPVPLAWSPAQDGRFDAGAGVLVIAAPEPSARARLAWEPLRWQRDELHSSGRLTGLPLQWAERLGGDALREAGVTGDVVFDGAWDLTLGATLHAQASLARASGDLTLLATDAESGVQSRVPAGLRQARLALASDGRALELRLDWDSTQAGSASGQLRTELGATRDADGATRWRWPEDAPLQGRLAARLPQISAWSVLAPPGWRLRGALAADVRVGGTRTAPLLDGSLSADDLALRSVVDGIALEDGRLRARLDGTRLRIDEFSLQGAGPPGTGGQLHASGEAGWIDGRLQAQLEARLERLRASVRSDRELSISGRAQARLDHRAVRVDGQLQVDRARIVLPDENAPRMDDDVIVRGAGGKVMYGHQGPGAVAAPTSGAGQELAARQERSAVARAQAADPLSVDAHVAIDLGSDFRVSGMGIDTRLAGQLVLNAAGPLGTTPRLAGKVRTEGGTFHAYGQQLQIERGNIVFTGDVANPALEIIALRPNYTSDQRVGVEVAGSALLPRVRLYSQPHLPDSQALAWLVLGREAPESGAESALLQTAALALLGGREGRGLAATFGLDELSFSNGQGDVGNASVTLGKRLSDRLYAAYEHSVAGASGTLLIFYELSRRWSLRGQAGVDSAVDLIYRLSFD